MWKGLDLTVEAALQVAHAISTHEARPEVDYYVAADDIPGDDAGAGYVDEAMFASACFYKYFSIHWETLVENLEGFQGNKELGRPHGWGVHSRGGDGQSHGQAEQLRRTQSPRWNADRDQGTRRISYANAFAKPVAQGERDIISQSIAQLGQYIHDLDTGYGKPQQRFWFSPNLRYDW